MTYSHAKVQSQRSVGSEENKQTKQMDGQMYIQCVQKKHPLLFSCVTFSQVSQFAQKCQCK